MRQLKESFRSEWQGCVEISYIGSNLNTKITCVISRLVVLDHLLHVSLWSFGGPACSQICIFRLHSIP